jgi:PAS domain S-box-containing protein
MMDSDSKKPPPPPSFVRSPEHLMDFVDTAGVGLHWVASDGTIVWANPADYEPLGYTADEYIGHNITEFHADDDVIADILRRLSGGERLHDYEARLKAKDGSIRYVQIRSSVLFEDGPERKFVHTRCYTQDITERKRSELARDRFVSILAHDLRNPLNSISMAAQHLLAGDVSEKQKRTIERISTSSERMAKMIVDLMEFARTLGDKVPLKRTSVDFGAVCQRISDEVRTANVGATIEVNCDGDLRGEWDAERLSQAISNLLTNAIQHGESPFVVRVRAVANDVVLQVSNRGRPISPEAIAEVFEPFSQSTSTTGLGLGLFIVKEIVTAHGGTIQVRSSVEDGTIFTSTWPKTCQGEP